MPASSQASRLLSTASFTVVSSAFRLLSKPSRCRFLAKNSETLISRCALDMDSAVAYLPRDLRRFAPSPLKGEGWGEGLTPRCSPGFSPVRFDLLFVGMGFAWPEGEPSGVNRNCN